MIKKENQIHKTPKELVKEMDKYIIGQQDAKKAVAIAFVDRYRRMMIEDDELRAEILPKNVLLSGSTGVGKTEIARRIANITDSPFLKVEMTKFTEVGYAGKDVETIIRDLVDLTMKREKDRLTKEREPISKKEAIKCVMRALKEAGKENVLEDDVMCGKYDNEQIKIEAPDLPSNKDSFNDFSGNFSGGNAMISIIPLFEFGHAKHKREKLLKEMKVREAIEVLTEGDIAEYLDKHLVASDVLKKVEQNGIIFLDEIDKLISNRENQSRGEVSREGVQRDLLPLVEGTIVQTKHGSVRTDHILFIAAGSFHDNKVSDLMPELQGRFPVYIALKSLSVEDFEHILTDLKYNLLEQQQELLKVDDINIKFEKDGIKTMAEIACRLNSELEDTGARRLFSVIEKVLEDISFEGKNDSEIIIDKLYVVKMTEKSFDKKVNVKKYII